MSTPLANREPAVIQPYHHWTVADYHRMGEVGLLNEDSRVELINGEIVEMAPIGYEHAGHQSYLFNFFAHIWHGKAVIAGQNPVILGGYEEPQPDSALLRWRDDFFKTAHPHAEDILLLVEIFNSTTYYD